jgi:hypothetical protein
MECGLIFNKENKNIVISSQTACEWSCVVLRGNITLGQYYGKLSESGTTNVPIFTYGNGEMCGEIECHFRNEKCIQKEKLTISTTTIPYFHVSNSKIFLFGKDTCSYLYVYYGTPSQNDNNVLPNLRVNVEDMSFEYSGSATYHTVNYGDIDLYHLIFQPYNQNAGYVEICIYSLTDVKYTDNISIEVGQLEGNYQFPTTKAIVEVRQDVVEHLPTLLKISPTFIFLDSNNPKQKINVTSLYNGQNCGYIISSNISQNTYR